jgi:hypothetical protein
VLYLDENYVAHAQQDEGAARTPWNDAAGFFAGKCAAYIEGYRVVPDGATWVREDGVEFAGPMIAPVVNPSVLLAMQAEADKAVIAELDQAVVELTYQNILLELGV